MNRIKEYFHDPMIVILAVLLVFLTLGTGISGCVNNSGNKTVICIDAAYGDSNKGYEGIVDEAEVTGKVADELESLLKSNRKFKVIRTDRSQSVKQRSTFINESAADAVISIHCAQDADSSVTGMKNIAQVPSVTGANSSLKLAQCISDAFKNDADSVFTGYMYYRSEDDTVLKEYVDASDTTTYPYDTYDLLQNCTKTPVVTELCHNTSQSDVDNWCNEKGYKKAAQLYYQAILKYYEQ